MEPQNPALDRWKQEAQAIARTFEELWSGASEEQRRWKQNAKSWSIAECIDHLRATNAAYRINLESAIAGAKRKGGRPQKPYAPGRLAHWLHGQLDPERSKRRLPAPGVFRPTMDRSDPEVLHRFLEEQQEVLRLLADAEEIDLNRSKLASPATPLLRLSVGEAFEAIVLHERRHLLQAQNLLKKAGFPGAK